MFLLRYFTSLVQTGSGRRSIAGYNSVTVMGLFFFQSFHCLPLEAYLYTLNFEASPKL